MHADSALSLTSGQRIQSRGRWGGASFAYDSIAEAGQFLRSGILRATGLASGEALVNASGSGRVEIKSVSSDDLQVNLNGSGATALQGARKKARFRVMGNGSVDAVALRVTDLHMLVNGTGSADAFAERSAKVVLVGSGRATVGGRPACSVWRTGGGIVRCGDIDR